MGFFFPFVVCKLYTLWHAKKIAEPFLARFVFVHIKLDRTKVNYMPLHILIHTSFGGDILGIGLNRALVAKNKTPRLTHLYFVER